MLDSYDITKHEGLRQCIEFHGHLCPGLVYGYRVAKEAAQLLDVRRSIDEEIVAIAENDSCAVDSLQVILGTTAGKGNLILKDYGKNVYTVMNRNSRKAFRFSRTQSYRYAGDHQEEFSGLEEAVSAGTAEDAQIWRHKYLKALDLLTKPFDELFSVSPAADDLPPYAAIARSVSCAQCGEMTMATKMRSAEDGKLLCIPCATKNG